MLMDLRFDQDAAVGYKGRTQRIRRMSEAWAHRELSCPACGGARLDVFTNNMPVADLYCEVCKEQFELKAKAQSIGRKVIDGAYSTMMTRLQSDTNPNLLLLTYDRSDLSVTGLTLVPRYFFRPDMIEAKKPTPPDAKRPNWVGCFIVLAAVPQIGKVMIIAERQGRPASGIVSQWRSCAFLARQKLEARGWSIEVISIVERIGRESFTLSDIYAFEGDLSARYPLNFNVRAKIRQQTQVLRDKGLLVFEGGGRYRRMW